MRKLIQYTILTSNQTLLTSVFLFIYGLLVIEEHICVSNEIFQIVLHLLCPVKYLCTLEIILSFISSPTFSYVQHIEDYLDFNIYTIYDLFNFFLSVEMDSDNLNPIFFLFSLLLS